MRKWRKKWRRTTKRGRRSHVLFTGRCSEVARWVTEWQIAKVVEDHEEGEEEEKEPIHSLVGRGGERHKEEGRSVDILIRRSPMFVVNDNSKSSSILCLIIVN
mmetsp:Transcript_21514/g.33280  ORF Transcript_21514/g.33280 Transcript_21514/m.33280 type:complete len:103 (+) Transcript_21514:67-375(+)